MYNDEEDNIYQNQNKIKKNKYNKKKESEEEIDYNEQIDYQYGSGLEQNLHTEEHIEIKKRINKYFIRDLILVLVTLAIAIYLAIYIINYFDDGSNGIIKLNINKINLTPTQSLTLNAKIENTRYNPEIKWTSSDEKIITVENGLIKAIKKGKATITVSYTDRKGDIHKDICEIEVK